MVNDILKSLIGEKKMRLKGRLYHHTQVKFAYNSNRIEGSRLTGEQTRYIFETNTIIAGNKDIVFVNDIVETVNHFSCFDYLIKVAE